MRPKKYLLIVSAVMTILLMASCGGSNSNSSQNPTSGLKKRVLLTNSLAAQNGIQSTTPGLSIVDAQKDLFSRPISNANLGKMVTASGMTVVMNTVGNQIQIFNNKTEQITSSPMLLGPPFDVAISTDGLTAYTAVRNSGLVEIFNTASGNIVTSITIPSVTRLVEGPNEHMLLAFSDDPQTLVGTTNTVPNANSFFVINTSMNTATAIQEPAGSQPLSAVFDPSDTSDNTAFILNCGSECGGVNGSASVAPSVVRVNFSNPLSPVFSAPIPVSGATVGLLTGSSLFVAGTPSGSATGTMQVINTGSLTASTAIAITNGLHTQMAMTSNGRLYIGASNCTIGTASNTQVAGCLSIFNTSTQAVVIPVEPSVRSNFNVTGLQPISNRNVIYVCQGGELDIFDITTDAPSTSITQLDVVGNAFDVVQIDP